MEKEKNFVYVKTKKGIYKCYKTEQMNKPIYYPVECKTNGFIDYNEIICLLSIDDLYNQLKKQKEIIDKIKYIFNNGSFEDGCDCILIEKLLEDKGE